MKSLILAAACASLAVARKPFHWDSLDKALPTLSFVDGKHIDGAGGNCASWQVVGPNDKGVVEPKCDVFVGEDKSDDQYVAILAHVDKGKCLNWTVEVTEDHQAVPVCLKGGKISRRDKKPKPPKVPVSPPLPTYDYVGRHEENAHMLKCNKWVVHEEADAEGVFAPECDDFQGDSKSNYYFEYKAQITSHIECGKWDVEISEDGYSIHPKCIQGKWSTAVSPNPGSEECFWKGKKPKYCKEKEFHKEPKEGREGKKVKGGKN